MKNARAALLLAPLLAGLFLARTSAAAEPSCASPQCHEKLVKGKTLHAAAESCDGCHESVATPHPQKGKKTFKLGAPQAELCASCHDAFGKKTHVHPPVKDGECTTCHDPHSSDQPKLLSSPVGELCGACHSDHVEFKVVHGPVSAGECTACHTPHESAEKALLLTRGDQLCFSCHTDLQEELKKKVIHPAVEAGCTSCHNPHGSAQRALLAETGAALCFGCHGDLGEKVGKAVVGHAPVASEKGCGTCHSPHATDQAKLLLRPEKDLCVGCHKTIVTKAMTVLHGPISGGRCAPCHEPHGSPNAHLLTGSFSADPYVPYTDTAYGLCFSCHKRDLLLFPDTSFATGFRDGDRNLHFLHVNNKQKGRSCRLCHAIHGADNPVLLAEKVPFARWSLPIKFVKSENGGSCSPGCHKPFAYDRSKRGTNPSEPPKPASASVSGPRGG